MRRFNGELSSAHGLTINDYEVLLHLAQAPERMMRRVDLAKSVVLTPSGITRLLEGLERCGYVERASCSSDARVTYALLTDEGYEKLREASATHIEGIRSHFEGASRPRSWRRWANCSPVCRSPTPPTKSVASRT